MSTNIASILFFTSETYPTFAGDGRNALLFAKTLHSMGLRSDLMCLNPNGLLKSEETIFGVNVFRVNYFYHTLLGRAISRILIGIKILKIQKDYKFWLIYGGMPCHRLIIVLGRVLQKKVIYRSTLWNFDDANTLCSGNSLIIKNIRSRLYGSTSAYFALNESFRNTWIDKLKYCKPIFLSTQGVDCNIYSDNKYTDSVSRKSLGIDESDFVVLIIGHLIRRKGFVELFEWLSRMPIQLKVIHVGRCDAPNWDIISTRNKEMREIKNYGINTLGDNLLFIGETENVDVYMRIANVFILNSESEGFPPNSLSEAMTSGLPTLVRKIEGIEDFLVDGENALIYSSPNEFEEKFNYLVENSSERVRIGQNARGWMIKNNSIEVVAKNFVNFINSNLA